MNKAIELHDSELVAASFDGSSAIVSLNPSYVHSSAGIPGTDSGSGWLQSATLTFTGVSAIPALPHLPVDISEGSLRFGGACHTNIIPASGTFQAVEFSIVLSTAESFTIRAQSLTIDLHGEPTFVEVFNK